MGGDGVFVVTLVAQGARVEGALDAEDGPDADGWREERVDVGLDGRVGGKGRGFDDEFEGDDVESSMDPCIRASCPRESDLLVRVRTASGALRRRGRAFWWLVALSALTAPALIKACQTSPSMVGVPGLLKRAR